MIKVLALTSCATLNSQEHPEQFLGMKVRAVFSTQVSEASGW
jgi:hypothetical protein